MEREHTRVRFMVALAAVTTVIGTSLGVNARNLACSCTLPITGCNGVTKNCPRTETCCCCPAGAAWSCDCVDMTECTTGAKQCRGNPTVAPPTTLR